MDQRKLKGINVAILATDGVEQSELAEPREYLETEGARTILLSPKLDRIQSMQHDEKGEIFNVDEGLNEANPEDFDAVLLPGGALNADHLRVSKQAQEFVKKMDIAEKPIAVICHGPWLLVSAGLVKGRTLTSYHTIQDDIRNAGGIWEDKEVIRDQNWVSSRQPSDIPAFNRAMGELFAESAEKKKAA